MKILIITLVALLSVSASAKPRDFYSVIETNEYGMPIDHDSYDTDTFVYTYKDSSIFRIGPVVDEQAAILAGEKVQKAVDNGDLETLAELGAKIDLDVDNCVYNEGGVGMYNYKKVLSEGYLKVYGTINTNMNGSKTAVFQVWPPCQKEVLPLNEAKNIPGIQKK